MALLVPFLLPVISEVAAGISTLSTQSFFSHGAQYHVAVGIANATQGEKSGFTLQIGNKVFTNTESFPFNSLPCVLPTPTYSLISSQ
jgi:hypothetical protein